MRTSSSASQGRSTEFRGFKFSQAAPRQLHLAGGAAMVSAEKAKGLLALHGEVRPQPVTDWTGSFPIPPAIARFYWEVGPADITIKAHGNPYFFPCLADLWKFQAGYRWNGL